MQVTCGKCSTQLTLPCKTVAEMKKKLIKWGWKEFPEKWGWLCPECKEKVK